MKTSPSFNNIVRLVGIGSSAAIPVGLAVVFWAVYVVKAPKMETRYSFVPDGSAALSSFFRRSTSPSDSPRVIEFFDYQCPFCRRQEAIIQSLAKQSKGFEFDQIDYPLPMHNLALPAALVARAADKLGKLSQVREILFRGESLSLPQLERAKDLVLAGASKTIAAQLLSDAKKEVAGETKLGNALGVQGTPSFFVLLEGQCFQADSFQDAADIATGKLKTQ